MQDPTNRPIFERRLRPHRSLSQRGFWILMGAFAAAMAASSLPFLLLGAWPVVGFMGLDEFGTQRLALASRGRQVEIASFLGPYAKADFADGLTRALSEARRGPRFD